MIATVGRVALRRLALLENADEYLEELIADVGEPTSLILDSGHQKDEWLAVMADPLLTQSALGRLKSAARELVIEGQPYRQREKTTLGPRPGKAPAPGGHRRGA